MKKLSFLLIFFLLSGINSFANLGPSGLTEKPKETKTIENKNGPSYKSDKVKSKASSTRKKILRDEKKERRNYLNIKNYDDRPNE